MAIRKKASRGSLRLGKGRGRSLKPIEPALLTALVAGNFKSLRDWSEEAGVSLSAAKELQKSNNAEQRLKQQEKEERWKTRVIAAVKTTMKRLVAQPVKAKTRSGRKRRVVGYTQCAAHMRRCWRGELKLRDVPPSWVPNKEQWGIIIKLKEVGYSNVRSRTRPLATRPAGWFQRVADYRTPRRSQGK